MIRNLFTVAIRSFLRQRLYSLINVVGLASGLTCALFIYLWVNDEVQKDHFHKDVDRIYTVVSNLTLNDGKVLTWAITPGPLAEDILSNDPEVEYAVRTSGSGNMLFQYGDKSFMENGIFADPGFFQIFSFNILHGKPNLDTTDVSHVSISEKLATRLFGDEDPVGKTIRVNNNRDLTVSAVFHNPGTVSSLQFDFVLPFEIYKKNRGTGFNWDNYDHPLYLKVNDPSKIQDVIDRIHKRRDAAAAAAARNNGQGERFYAQPFAEHYLNSQYENGLPSGGRIRYVQIFSLVAVFIVIIACINFMTLATARASTRAKEVGIRKTVGAQRQSLVSQFIAESTLTSAIAALIALAVTYLLLPMFNSLVTKEIELVFDARFLLVLTGIILVTGLLAGSYPAFVLSGYKPALVLKGSGMQTGGAPTLRQSLVVFQFALTVILISSSLVVYKQIQYIRNKNIGYDREAVLNFGARGGFSKNYDAFRNDALQHPAIVNVSRANSTLVQVENQNSSVSWPGKAEDDDIFFRTVVADYDFLETMGLKIVEGRSFNRASQDTASFIVSEKAVEVMGLADPIGTEIVQWGMKGTIIGVVNDFHSRSLHEKIDPIVFMCRPEWTGQVYVKFAAGKTGEAISHIESLYKKYNPEYPFSYSFLEDDFERLYNNEKVTGSLALGFTVMAIIISGLGLLGLAAYTAERRRKEISIRKALGASVSRIVVMMSSEFVRLAVMAAAIGCPVAWYLMDQLLSGYAYRPPLGWGLFALTAGVVMVLAILIVIFQVVKAALANPVEALRNE